MITKDEAYNEIRKIILKNKEPYKILLEIQDFIKEDYRKEAEKLNEELAKERVVLDI